MRMGARPTVHASLGDAIGSFESSGPGTEGKCSTSTGSTSSTARTLAKLNYAFLGKPGETIILGSARRVRVVDVIDVEEEDSPYVGLLLVESA
jgi:hypothetical protein